MRDIIPCVKISPRRLAWFSYFEGCRRSSSQWKSKPNIDLYRRFEFSNQEAKNIEDKINYMVLLAKPKWTYSKEDKKWYKMALNFITLTLSDSQKQSDVYIKKNMLNDFLTRLRQIHLVNMYVWRAETQRNGNIHFHIICDKWIHWKVIRDTWNGIQKKHGYLTHFYNCHGHYDVNSTDVHSVKRIRNLGAYLSKYMKKTQSEKNSLAADKMFGVYSIQNHCRIIEGRRWGCCYFLSKLKNITFILSTSIESELAKLVQKFQIFEVPGCYCTIIKSTIQEWKVLAPLLWSKWLNYLSELYNDSSFIAEFQNIN